MAHPPDECPLSFALEGHAIARYVRDAAGVLRRTLVPLASSSADAAAFDAAWLRCVSPPWHPQPCGRLLRTADLFSGCSGMSLGVTDAAWALGRAHETALALDVNESALRVFADNFRPRVSRAVPAESLFDGESGAPLTPTERRLREEVGPIDLLVGGPPCQGNSDLNNHTRRADVRNDLYARMARAAVVLAADHVVIENVPGVVHDRTDVVARTAGRLQEFGYRVASGILDATRLGVPQKRRRHFLVASKTVRLDLAAVQRAHHGPPRPLAWAIGDLLDVQGGGTFDTRARHHPRNVRRIDYLFDHDLDDLPDAQRPDCHRLKAHAYQAVYGRMRWDEPAPTITRGFGCTGQGRFVHPLLRGTLTPHEAARVQCFPDFFGFGNLGRRALQELIGNAVPSRLAFVVVLELLRKVPHG